MDGFNNDPEVMLDSESADGADSTDKARLMVETGGFDSRQGRTDDQFH